jgi:hypothetical protein
MPIIGSDEVECKQVLTFDPVLICEGVVKVGTRCSILNGSITTFASINGSISSIVGLLIVDVAIHINSSTRRSKVWLSNTASLGIEPTTKLIFFQYPHKFEFECQLLL